MRANAATPAMQDWPAAGLELLGRCPVCDASPREALHEGLGDLLFDAPGRWTLYRCGGCGIGYLDPRPTADTLPLAYRQYHTHQGTADHDLDHAPAGLRARLRHWLLRGYLRATYADSSPSGPAAWLVRALPRGRAIVDASMRHLPRPWGGRRLLDIGCGSGRFISWARWAGWQACGTEVDAAAASQARSLGLEVHLGDAADLVAAGRRFEQVTIGHVIEHVPDPLTLLRVAASLLAPGGRLWIETPNMDAHGHDVFGPAWRGLEPPRHLQLFTPEALARLCERAGLVDVRLAPWQPDWHSTAGPSRALARRMALRPAGLQQWLGGLVGLFAPGKREFITLVARAPDQR